MRAIGAVPRFQLTINGSLSSIHLPTQNFRPPRSILAVSTEKLLDVLADLGPEKVRSVYQLFRDISDDEGALMINRLRSIEVGEDAQDGWRKVFTFHTESGTPVADQRDISVVARTTNRVEIARFTRANVGPIDVASIKD